MKHSIRLSEAFRLVDNGKSKNRIPLLGTVVVGVAIKKKFPTILATSLNCHRRARGNFWALV